MQTLRKKTSPCKYKNEPSRFLGEGVSFKAKLIGILEVSEARGDRMCQEALADLKMAIRAAGEHKQRITINIAIDGLRLRDEKTGDSLYHHPVHKISFIAQDMSDSRAFGYIFGSPDTGHRFFGIKTDKAASQVVIAMRDLFQVVFELKKKEIELAKQHIEQKSRFSSNTTSSLFTDTAITNTKGYQNGESHTTTKLISVSETTSTKIASTSSEGATARPESAIADLVDLELELSSIQQGIHQMERITPSDPFGPSKDDPFTSDPFGDSFTSFPQKPFLPPPPSARDRPSRNASTSDTSSIFSPKTPRTTGSIDTTSQEAASLFKTSQDEPTSGWFTPTGGNDSLFEDAVTSTTGDTEPTATTVTCQKDQKDTTEATQKEILSQFDVFTELDPLGTGRSKPYIDKKLFFQELKNPPKKVLKDLVTETTQPMESSLFTANFDTNLNTSTTSGIFQNDPFAESDPFDKTDPFAEDPFDTEFVSDFKGFNKEDDKFKFPDTKISSSSLFPTTSLSKSPRSTITSSIKFENTDKKFGNRHENPSLDMSSESESAPEPPPRPTTNITSIKPPPLPPKKQLGDLAIKPPPRPPHSEESHYDYMDNYESGLNSLEHSDTPPLPVPARKNRFDSTEFAPQRPNKKQNHIEDDYLQPIAPPLLPPQKKSKDLNQVGPILLPPPMKKETSKRSQQQNNQVTVASYLENKPKLISTTAGDKISLTPDTLDITLSQLTLSGLNELANKLNIPASQLSNMTLVQLTNYLSNYVKTNNVTGTTTSSGSTNNDATFPTFKADFSTNFNDANNSGTKTEPYDRYAVFRELLQQEEITNKTEEPTKQQQKPEEEEEEEEEEGTEVVEKSQENIPDKSHISNSTSCSGITKTEENPTNETKKVINSEIFKPVFEDTTNKTDRYAALREIIIEDTIINSESKDVNEDELLEESKEEIIENEEKQNDLNQPKSKDPDSISNTNIIEYDTTNSEKLKSPDKKSPLPAPPITEIIQTVNHLTSGSVSDVISNSSPEIDNLEPSLEPDTEVISKKNNENNSTTRESWAIFDTPNRNSNNNNNNNRDKDVGRKEKDKSQAQQSEEGVSPWSSDSKEFGNGSPSEWQQKRDSGSEGDWNRRRRDREPGWWDTQGDIGHYEKPRGPYPRDRRSTDSYDDDWYEPDRPRRRTRQPGHGGSHSTHSANVTSGSIVKGSGSRGSRESGGRESEPGGQSSSSRDVSPWEEEPRRRDECWSSCRRREWERRRRDSWDEEDDYDYEDDYMSSSKFHWPERHGSRESDRASRDSDRHSGHSGSRGEPPDHWDSGGDQWPDDRRHMRRRGHPQDDRWCRPDWDHENDMICSKEKMRYHPRWSQESSKYRDRDRKPRDDRYYKRDHSQESPWEDDYSNDPDEPHSPRYLTARRNWKRPSSASEMDRKSGEIKSRAPYYVQAAGSDGERDRKYRANRRSRSRDSQFSEISHPRHKLETSLTLGRYSHRNREKYNQKFENDFAPSDSTVKNKIDIKSATVGRKKGKEILTSPKLENEPISTKNRKQHLMFENDFINSETESPVASKTKFNFENDFETSEAESPVTNTRYSSSSSKSRSHHLRITNDFNNSKEQQKPPKSLSPQMKQKSLFEDDFSPTEKLPDDNGITVIAEETSTISEPRVSFTENNLDKSSTPSETRRNKNILSKSRITNNIRSDANIKKSESVNIFARENDPFDDDFFSGRDDSETQKVENTKLSSSNNVEFKWTEDFDSFDIPEEK